MSAVAWALGGCGHAICTSEFRYGLAVHVVSAATGASICSAAVTAADDTYREALTRVQTLDADGGVDCFYQGAGERAGTYTVDAKIGGTEKMVAGVVVTRDACHVVPTAVTIDL